jgi:hypothetical protein
MRLAIAGIAFQQRLRDGEAIGEPARLQGFLRGLQLLVTIVHALVPSSKTAGRAKPFPPS